MIDRVYGVVRSHKGQVLICQVGGFGLEISVPSYTVLEEGIDVVLFTYMHWVQDSAPALFGFYLEVDRAMFLLILGCSGIGPKLALALLSDLTVSGIISATQSTDYSRINQVSGFGQRKTEQLVMYLKHKLDRFIDVYAGELQSVKTEWSLVAQALDSLGYSKQEIQRVSAVIHRDFSHIQTFDQLLKKALSLLT